MSAPPQNGQVVFSRLPSIDIAFCDFARIVAIEYELIQPCLAVRADGVGEKMPLLCPEFSSALGASIRQEFGLTHAAASLPLKRALPQRYAEVATRQ
jgi:hypothetical protein